MRKWVMAFLLACFSSQACFGSCFGFLSDFYVGALAGYNGGYDVSRKGVETNRGTYLGIKTGKKIFPWFKVEQEVIWQENKAHSKMHSMEQGPVRLDHVRGHIDIWSLMINGICDICFEFPVWPFLGGGIGYAYAHGHWEGEVVTTNGNFSCFGKREKSSLNKSNFAWQVIAGLNYPTCLGLQISLEYHYFEMSCCIKNHKLGLSLTKFF